MARTVITTGSGGFLPDGAAEYIKGRIRQGAGLALVVAAGALLAALFSYAPGDPSFNSATDGLTRNLMGGRGAYAADLLLQTFGAAAALPALVLAAWGWKLMLKRNVSLPGVRLTMLAAAVVLAAIGSSALSPPGAWPLMTGLGGIAGSVLAERLGALALAGGLAAEPWIVASASAALATLALAAALGFDRTEWRDLAAAPARLGSMLANSWRWGRDAIAGLADPGVDFGFDEAGPEAIDALDEGPRRKPAVPTRADLVAPKAARLKAGRRAKSARQGMLDLAPSEEYRIPPLEILQSPGATSGGGEHNRDALQQNAAMLEKVLEDIGVRGEILKVRPGPVVTLYELEPAPGTKTSRVIGLSDDIARSMSAVSVRVAVVPGRNVIGIELPNAHREMVHLRELLESDALERSPGNLNLALGKDISGAPVIVDLGRMPHLLIAGTTGSGKSVAINTMILSLLYQMSPEACKFIMIDPKMLELSVYEGIPHLLSPVVTEPSKAVVALKWTVREMEERYRTMSHLGVRNIDGYNARLEKARKKGKALTRKVQTGFDETGKPVFEEQPLSMEPLPLIVVVVDEMADLMLVAGKDIEAAVQRLAQMARAAGIHLIMATQRPSVDVITGTIKANFPTRVSFQVTSKIDSRTILGEQGAEQLLGQGDMLYMAGGGRITRIHGPFVSDIEVENVVNHLKRQGKPDYIEEVTEEADDAIFASSGGVQSADTLYDEAVALIAREGKASTSFIQRHLQIGYNRAARIIERMEGEGIVSKANRVGRREVLIGAAGD